MAKYLVTFKDLLDDIEISGFSTMTEKELSDYEQLATSITWSFSFNSGEMTLHFTDGEDLLSKLDFKEITSEELRVVKKVFDNEFGVFVSQSFLDNLTEEDEDDFDDIEDDGLQLYNDDDDDDDDY